MVLNSFYTYTSLTHTYTHRRARAYAYILETTTCVIEMCLSMEVFMKCVKDREGGRERWSGEVDITIPGET